MVPIVSSLPLSTISTQRPLRDCINACQISPLAHSFLTPNFDHKSLHINYLNLYLHCAASLFDMAISQREKVTRIAKPRAAPRKLWTEAIKEKLVQHAAYRQPAHAQLANRPKSRHNAALQMALCCTECKNMEITPYQMNIDVAMNLYITTEYPPYFTDATAPIEQISPLDTGSYRSDCLTFWSDITSSQKNRYYEAVDTIIKKIEAETGQRANEATVLYAHYQVDVHIRQHYMRTQTMLNLCRDKKDVLEMRHWQWEVAESEGTALEKDPKWGVGWVWDTTNSLDHQYEGWKLREKERKVHLVNVRSQWAKILEERKKQRERTVTLSFRGEPVRVYSYEPPCEPPLSRDEIKEIAARNAYNTSILKLLVGPF